jgi:sphingomyelin phosphodiesterase
MVYIIGHIPPKSNLNEWSMRFNAIVDRYSYIIRGQFYGHTHEDQFSFFPDFAKMQNIDTAPLSNYYLISPSFTTYSNRIPEYRVMEVDFDTLQVKDYSQYRYYSFNSDLISENILKKIKIHPLNCYINLRRHIKLMI